MMTVLSEPDAPSTGHHHISTKTASHPHGAAPLLTHHPARTHFPALLALCTRLSKHNVHPYWQHLVGLRLSCSRRFGPFPTNSLLYKTKPKTLATVINLTHRQTLPASFKESKQPVRPGSRVGASKTFLVRLTPLSHFSQHKDLRSLQLGWD